jgi:hypothetical protein
LTDMRNWQRYSTISSIDGKIREYDGSRHCRRWIGLLRLCARQPTV